MTLAPKQQVLPPQVLLYVADPGKYFTVTLTNTTQEVQTVYLGMQMQHHGTEFYAGDGIVVKGVENTIKNVSDLAKKKGDDWDGIFG